MIQSGQPQESLLILLTGGKQEGKTSLLKTWIKGLHKSNIQVNGYLSESVQEKRSISGYVLHDIETQISYPFLSRKGQKDWQKTGSFYLDPEGLKQACEILKRKSGQVCVVDEIGPLELAGGGVASILWKLIENPERTYVLVIRRKILWNFMKKIKNPNLVLVDLMEGREKTLDNLTRLVLSDDTCVI